MERTKQMIDKDGEVKLMDEHYVAVSHCRVCHDMELEPVLDLGEQFLPRFVPEVDYGLPRAPLQLVRCVVCGLLQLKHTVQPDLLFRKYWYRSSINQTMKVALVHLVEHAVQYHKFGSWLDIGANDGYLLSQVPDAFQKTACEPALDFADALNDKAQRVVTDYFSAELCPGPYDVITSAACFYDVDDPHRFVADIAKVLSNDGIWVNQLNDSPTMMEKNGFDGICHEHLMYYSVPDLANLYRQHGLTITRVTHNEVNGGSVRVIARKSTRAREDMLGLKTPSREQVLAFAGRVKKWKERMLDLCHGPFAQHGCWVYGASTKLMVMLQYLDCHETWIAAAERNPLKYNLKMVGSWTPIVSEQAMRESRPAYVLCGPYSFREEFLRRERSLLDAGATMVMPLPSIELSL